jgi:hypothetical protein
VASSDQRSAIRRTGLTAGRRTNRGQVLPIADRCSLLAASRPVCAFVLTIDTEPDERVPVAGGRAERSGLAHTIERLEALRGRHPRRDGSAGS